jgi:predicted sugar kinase
MTVFENSLEKLTIYIHNFSRECQGCFEKQPGQMTHSCVMDAMRDIVRRNLDDALRAILTINELLYLAYSQTVDHLDKFENDRLNREYYRT